MRDDAASLDRRIVTLDHLLGRGPLFERSAVAVGNFDGVHKGHARILRLAVEHGSAAGETPVALTFDPHPRAVVGGGAPPALSWPDERDRVMSRAGIRAVVTLRFDQAVAALHPDEFVRQVLTQGLGARRVVVGDNFRFGHGARGTTETLRKLGQELGITVHVAEAVRDEGGRIVSSTRVRELVTCGDVDMAARLLDRPYAVVGRCTGRGHRYGISGWLVLPAAGLLLPAPGLYDVLAGPVGAEPQPGRAVVTPADAGERGLLLMADLDGCAAGDDVCVQFVSRRG